MSSSSLWRFVIIRLVSNPMRWDKWRMTWFLLAAVTWYLTKWRGALSDHVGGCRLITWREYMFDHVIWWVVCGMITRTVDHVISLTVWITWCCWQLESRDVANSWDHVMSVILRITWCRWWLGTRDIGDISDHAMTKCSSSRNSKDSCWSLSEKKIRYECKFLTFKEVCYAVNKGK